MIFASSGDGSWPNIMQRKFAAWLRSSRGATGSRPPRRRCIVATIVAACAISRMPAGSATSTFASWLLSSSAAAADTAVRRMSIGCAAFTRSMISITGCGMVRDALSFASNSRSCARSGSAPYSRR